MKNVQKFINRNDNGNTVKYQGRKKILHKQNPNQELILKKTEFHSRVDFGWNILVGNQF